MASSSGSKAEFIVGGKYKLVRKIGSGSFGDIYLAINITNGEVRAGGRPGPFARPSPSPFSTGVAAIKGGNLDTNRCCLFWLPAPKHLFPGEKKDPLFSKAQLLRPQSQAGPGSF